MVDAVVIKDHTLWCIVIYNMFVMSRQSIFGSKSRYSIAERIEFLYMMEIYSHLWSRDM